MPLRPYQKQAIEDLRGKFRRGFTRILYQLSTGAGKTVVFSAITRLAFEKNLRVWILVPRKKLLRQASKHLTKNKIPHGQINAACKESRAFKVHVVSQPTLLRRIASDKIKNWPKIIVVDECHLSLDQQIRIKNAAPEGTIIVGVTGTPKETSGRGLNEDEMYQDIILGPKHSELVELDYLAAFKYFCPPFDFKIKKKGNDYDPKTIEEILESRKIYGKVISHYSELAHGRPTLVFCPSIKNSEETAQKFRNSGYNFESVNGTMPESKIETILKAFEDGKIDGITSCDLVTFGVDLPNIECIILLRKTMSITKFFQMLGRGTRPLSGKDCCVILDHMGNFREHAIGEGETISQKFDVDWKKLFFGSEKNKAAKGEVVASLKLCNKCFMYYSGESCPHCGTERDTKKPIKYEEIEGRLIEIKGPIKLNDRPLEDRREIQDKIGELTEKYNSGMSDTVLAELLAIAEEIGRNAMWVYWELSRGMMAVNVPLLHGIRKARGYKTGWVFMQTQTIEKKLGRV